MGSLKGHQVLDPEELAFRRVPETRKGPGKRRVQLILLQPAERSTRARVGRMWLWKKGNHRRRPAKESRRGRGDDRK